tara:strand:- start:486 stop:809 length:324 start_codon:yes stop_codon:yes gene_type:complete
MEFITNAVSILFGIAGYFLSWLIIVLIIYAVLFGVKFLIWKNNPPPIIHKLRWVIAIAIGILMLWLKQSSGIGDPSDRTGMMIIGFVVYTIGTLVLKDEEKTEIKED